MAKSHYTADSAIVSAFKLAVYGDRGSPREQAVLALHALARHKSANEAMALPSPSN
ncbi:hypothetical protein IVB15_09280 [Bradyrhizobium sp. 182]|uniref:hypothetical protein n=1 Tax=unclassified Bradyrhizobium TaxID=2631580 RepID=UPI001FF70E33|nr:MULTISPECIES: hypothetical protein [unclassified Bradyrhizobium]MCK1422417.1 hypothetical protein [Bradyrhizobium sp. CW12]MCK1527930.1 hypothetical protein [Bradyrhizobium sp. 182]MCK1649037.1 hypothetical protein [Bradyrhizobium sp. 154]